MFSRIFGPNYGSYSMQKLLGENVSTQKKDHEGKG